MNILFLDSIEKETYGGMEEWILLAASGLSGRGNKISVAGRPKSEFLRRVSAAQPDISILELNISGDFNPVTIERLRQYLAEGETDIVSVNFNKDIRLGGLAARLNGKTRVVWSVGLDITKNKLVHRYLTPRLVDGVIVPSESLKKQIIASGYIDEEMVKVIPIGIGETAFSRPQTAAVELRAKYNLPDDSVIAVTVGRFVEQKGHFHLIEAAASVVKKFPNAFFIFLGDGPLKNSLRTEVDRRSLTRYFIFAGMLDNIDVERFGSDLMIHPSLEEPFGIALLEGMRSGLPIVASRVGGIPEVVSDRVNGLLVEPGSSSALHQAISSLLDSPEKRRALGKAGQERWRTSFKLETMIDRIESYFTAMMGSRQVSWKD